MPAVSRHTAQDMGICADIGESDGKTGLVGSKGRGMSSNRFEDNQGAAQHFAKGDHETESRVLANFSQYKSKCIGMCKSMSDFGIPHQL